MGFLYSHEVIPTQDGGYRLEIYNHKSGRIVYVTTRRDEKSARAGLLDFLYNGPNVDPKRRLRRSTEYVDRHLSGSNSEG